jgi:hypothetical protein
MTIFNNMRSMFLKMSSIELQARLLLDPLIGTYEQSLSIGHEATTALFHMIAAVASSIIRRFSTFASRLWTSVATGPLISHRLQE